MNRPEEVGGPLQVLNSQCEKKLLADQTPPQFLGDGGIVEVSLLDGVVVDRGITRQTGDRQATDPISQRAIIKQAAGNVVDPEALPQSVQLGGGCGWG